jgi:hypothetical protein
MNDQISNAVICQGLLDLMSHDIYLWVLQDNKAHFLKNLHQSSSLILSPEISLCVVRILLCNSNLVLFC